MTSAASDIILLLWIVLNILMRSLILMLVNLLSAEIADIGRWKTAYDFFFPARSSFVCLRVCLRICVCVCIRVFMLTYAPVCLFACVYVCLHVCLCV